MLSTQQGKEEQLKSSMSQLAGFTENYLTQWESDLKDSYLLALFIAENSEEEFCQAYGQIYCLNFLTLEYYMAKANNLALGDKSDVLDFAADVEAYLTDAQYTLNVCAEMAECMQSVYFNKNDFIPVMHEIILSFLEGDDEYPFELKQSVA